MSRFQWKESFDSLGNALTRLEEVLKEPLDDANIVMDATIQRFEFSFELFWKTLKRALLVVGVETKSPRETLKKAFQLGWIDDEELWLKMMYDRNAASHVYDEDKAREIYNNVQGYSLALREAYMGLAKKINGE